MPDSYMWRGNSKFKADSPWYQVTIVHQHIDFPLQTLNARWAEKEQFFLLFCSGSRWLKIDLCNFWPSKDFLVDAAVTRLHRSQWLVRRTPARLSPRPSHPPYESLSSPELFINDHLRIIKAQHNHSSDYHVCRRGWGLRESSDPMGWCRVHPARYGKSGRNNGCYLSQVPLPFIFRSQNMSFRYLLINQLNEWGMDGSSVLTMNSLLRKPVAVLPRMDGRKGTIHNYTIHYCHLPIAIWDQSHITSFITDHLKLLDISCSP